MRIESSLRGRRVEGILATAVARKRHLAGLEHAVHRGAADPHRCRKRTHGPTTRRRGHLEQCAHARIRVDGHGRFAASAWCITHQGIRPACLKPPPPERHRMRTDAESLCDRASRGSFSGEQHDVRAARDTLRRRTRTNPCRQTLAIGRSDKKSLLPHGGNSIPQTSKPPHPANGGDPWGVNALIFETTPSRTIAMSCSLAIKSLGRGTIVCLESPTLDRSRPVNDRSGAAHLGSTTIGTVGQTNAWTRRSVRIAYSEHLRSGG